MTIVHSAHHCEVHRAGAKKVHRCKACAKVMKWLVVQSAEQVQSRSNAFAGM